MLNPLVRKIGAELIGTFGLVIAGCGAIITSSHGDLSPIGVALTFGLVIAIMVAATGHISGGHINPAVSIGLWATRHLPFKDLLGYLAGQFVGAILGALTLWAIFGSRAAVALTVNAPGVHVSAIQATLVEALLTAFLVFVISAVATDAQSIGKLAAFAIGATITVDALWGGPLTGASMNPARSLGPALIAGNLTNLWIYFLGPIAGGLIGAGLYHLIRQPGAAVQAEKPTSAVVAARPRVSASNKRR